MPADKQAVDYRLLAFCGMAVTAFGTLAPVATSPLTGPMNAWPGVGTYDNILAGSESILAIMALLIAFIITATKKQKLAIFVSALGAVVVLIYGISIASLLMELSNTAEQVELLRSSGPFDPGSTESQLIEAFDGLSLSWGWLPLFLGAALTIWAGLSLKKSGEP